MILFVIIGYLLVSFIDMVPLIQQKKKKEAILYGVLMVCAFTLSVLLSLGIPVPSPAHPIENLIKGVLKM